MADAAPGIAGAAAAVTAALAASREPLAAPGTAEPPASGDDSHGAAPPGPVAMTAPTASTSPTTSTASTGSPAAPVTTPAHAALSNALSATTRLEGSQPGAASTSASQPTAASSAWSAAPASAAATSTAPANPAPQAPASPTVAAHAEVGSSGWANELGTRLHWMAGAGIGSASLRLTPEQLGPVEVRISVHQSSASVWFAAAQPETRSALEQALPQLRELFSAQGLNLAQAGVSDQSARGAPREVQAPLAGVRASAARELTATEITSAPRARQGLIDTYA